MTNPLAKDIREYPIEYQELNAAVDKLMANHPDVSVFFFATAAPASENKLRSLSGGGFGHPRHFSMLAHAAADMMKDAGAAWKVRQLTLLSKMIDHAVAMTFGARVTDSANVDTTRESN